MNKKGPQTRNPQALFEYLTGQRDALRLQVKRITRELVKLETELQAAAIAAELERAKVNP